MSQHAKDTFGNEASREQDPGQGRGQGLSQRRGQGAIPIEQAVEDSKDREENLTGLGGLAAQASGENTPTEASDASNTASNDDMRAAMRQAARAARAREMHAGDERPSVLNSDDTLHTLEDQGFSEDEALRLIAVTGRLEDSDEAHEAAVTLRRLRFTRWLVEQGKLDEWSV